MHAGLLLTWTEVCHVLMYMSLMPLCAFHACVRITSTAMFPRSSKLLNDATFLIGIFTCNIVMPNVLGFLTICWWIYCPIQDFSIYVCLSIIDISLHLVLCSYILLIAFSLPSRHSFMIEGTFLVCPYICMSHVSMGMGMSLVCFANDFMANLTYLDD